MGLPPIFYSVALVLAAQDEGRRLNLWLARVYIWRREVTPPTAGYGKPSITTQALAMR